MRILKKITAVALSIALAITLAGCGNSTGAQSDNKDKAQLKDIDLMLDWYPNALHTFIYVAKEKGYYEEEGLNVNIRFPSNANDAMSLVAAGRADIGLYYEQDVIEARTNEDIPIKSLGAVVQCPLNIILSLKDKNIKSPKDLIGKTVGYGGTVLSEAIVRSVMENAGESVDSVSLIDVGFDLMSAMTTGRVDATIGCLINHEVPELEEEGFELDIMKLTDYGVPNYYEGIFIANDEMIESEPETLEAFLRASKRGFEDTVNDPEGSLGILLANQDESNFPLSKEVETESLHTLLPLMQTEDAEFLSQSEDSWSENIDWMYNEGIIDKKLPADTFIADLKEN